MARLVELHPAGEAPELRRTTLRDKRLQEYLQYEVEQALSSRHPQESLWREARRQYSGIPRIPFRNTPVPNAPNIEVPLGAIETDAQYAAMTDTLYSASPLLTARALDEAWVEHAKAAQRWVNYGVANEFGLREATDHAFFETCQLGTGAFYIPFVENIYKHKVFGIRDRGPRVFPIPVENFIVPGGSYGDIQRDRWVAMRSWLQPDEMRLRARFRGWDMERAIPVASIDWVRRHHEQINLTDSASHWKELYEIWDIYLHFDYNGDGEDLDLLCHWDRSSRQILELDFNRYDNRPFELMRYQIRPHLAYGLGIMEMLRTFQDEATEVHNHRILNMMIANARVWIALDGYVPESMEIWPNKVVNVRDINAIKELKMGDVYPSSLQAEVAVTQLAERRVGSAGGQGASPPRSIGTRTPGITALSVAQSQNRRFTPAFDQMRLGAAAAVRQCLMRQRERLLLGDSQLESHITDVLGEDDAFRVIELLKQPNYERYVAVEFTAISPSTNREADRQAAVMIGTQLLLPYYAQTMQLIGQVANPQVPKEVVKVAMQVAEKSTEAMDRILRTFDQMRDPQQFLLNVQDDLGKMVQAKEQQGLGGLSQFLQGMTGGQNGGTPQGQVPVDQGGEEPVQ